MGEGGRRVKCEKGGAVWDSPRRAYPLKPFGREGEQRYEEGNGTRHGKEGRQRSSPGCKRGHPPRGHHEEVTLHRPPIGFFYLRKEAGRGRCQ
jgi:hypothetical protein